MEIKTQASRLDEVDTLTNSEIAREFYNERYAAGYMDDDDWSASKLKRVADLVAEIRLPRIGRALDFGCGTGVFTAVLQKALPDWTIVGTDVSSEALRRATARLPQCQFVELDACASKSQEFDLIFTHHVLEHVSDLKDTAKNLEKMLTTTGSMLHILPCGNPGSFAHRVCRKVRNGIDPERGGRYFFEEVGHLRRLSTNDVIALWSGKNLGIVRAYYAEQFFGAINAVTQFDLGFVLAFADPGLATTSKAAKSLLMLRIALATIWLMRKPAAVTRYKLRFGCRNVRDVILLCAGIVVYPLSAAVEWMLRTLSAREWSNRRQDPRGSEMYVLLARY